MLEWVSVPLKNAWYQLKRVFSSDLYFLELFQISPFHKYRPKIRVFLKDKFYIYFHLWNILNYFFGVVLISFSLMISSNNPVYQESFSFKAWSKAFSTLNPFWDACIMKTKVFKSLVLKRNRYLTQIILSIIKAKKKPSFEGFDWNAQSYNAMP